MDKHPSISEQFLTLINQIIEENLNNENFSVDILAQEAGVSRSALHRKLKRAIGKSASDLITEIRLTRAKELLENDAATASEIAYRVGFRDPSYFNKVFKKHFKVSPGRIRKEGAVTQPLKQTAPEPGRYGTLMFNWFTKPVRARIIAFSAVIAGICFLLYFTIFKTQKEPSIAVLPLRNLTGNPGNDYFVDGLHDALTGELGQISSLRVISTTSTRHFRDSNLILTEIADELGVNTVVEGSVLSTGDSIKILVQLIDVFPEEDHLLYSEYSDAIQDVPSMQTRVARDIAHSINIKLTRDEEQLLAREETINPETLKAYYRGMWYINRATTDEEINRGLDTLYSAITRDPADPNALAGYALGKAIQGHGSNITQAYFRNATAYAERAIKIDRSNYMAHLALALIHQYQDWDWQKAREEFEDAIRNNPNNDVAHAHYAWNLVVFEDWEEAIYHAQTAVEIEPMSSAYKSWLSWLYFIKQDYNLAEYWALESINIDDNIPWGNVVLGWIYLQQKQYDKALQCHEKLPDQSIQWNWLRCRTYVHTGQREKALAIWNEMKNDPEKKINPFYKGMVAATLGFKDEAFELLNEACEKKFYPINAINTFPSVEFIRDDPRYDTLLFKLNLSIPRKELTGL